MTIRTSWQRSVALLLLVFSCWQPSCRAASFTVVPVMQAPLKLSPSAEQLARALGMTARIDELNAVHVVDSNDDKAAIRQLLVKQDITHTAMIAMLQVRGANAQIAADLAEASQIRGVLEARRDRAVQLNTIANFTSQGITEVIGGALQLVPRANYSNAGNITEIVGGGLQGVLSTVALRQQRGGGHRGPLQPNMLAAIFSLDPDEDSKYPPVVWDYLNAVLPGKESSRLEALKNNWIKLGWLKKPLRPMQLAALSGAGDRHDPLTIATLQDRESMLNDLSAAISQIDRDLVEIMLYVQLAK